MLETPTELALAAIVVELALILMVLIMKER